MHYIGIDIGTSSICGVAYNPETGTTDIVSRPNGASVSSCCSDEKLQDPSAIMACVRSIADELIDAHADAVSIGISGQMHGILYLDIDGNAISPLYTWQDGRGNRQLDSGSSYAEYLTSVSGYPVATGYGLVTHFYNSRNGLVPDNARRLCTIMDYAGMKLTGRRSPLTDYTNGASLGFFDKRSLCFDHEALGRAGIDAAILPDLAPSATLLGQYRNIPVYSAIGDNQAAFIGSVADRSSAVHVTVGTSSQISVYTPEYVEVATLDTRPLPGGGYILAGAELCGGYSFTILKNFFAETARLICGKDMSDSDIYAAMLSVPYLADSTLSVETLFDGTRQDPGKRGSVTGISSSNFTPQELICGFARGICDALHAYYRLLPPSLQENKTHIVASGNGLRRNHLLRQALEDRFGLPVILSACAEEAALGAALSMH